MNKSSLIFNETLRICLDCFARLRIYDCLKLAELSWNFGRKAVDNDWLSSSDRSLNIKNDKLGSEFPNLMNGIFRIAQDVS